MTLDVQFIYLRNQQSIGRRHEELIDGDSIRRGGSGGSNGGKVL